MIPLLGMLSLLLLLLLVPWSRGRETVRTPARRLEEKGEEEAGRALCRGRWQQTCSNTMAQQNRSRQPKDRETKRTGAAAEGWGSKPQTKNTSAEGTVRAKEIFGRCRC